MWQNVKKFKVLEYKENNTLLGLDTCSEMAHYISQASLLDFSDEGT